MHQDHMQRLKLKKWNYGSNVMKIYGVVQVAGLDDAKID